MRLENWSVVLKEDPYLPPECWRPKLRGEVEFHRRKLGHGGPVSTSQPVKLFQLVLRGAATSAGIFVPFAFGVETRSGSRYELGVVDPEWAEYLRTHSKFSPIEALKKFFDL